MGVIVGSIVLMTILIDDGVLFDNSAIVGTLTVSFGAFLPCALRLALLRFHPAARRGDISDERILRRLRSRYRGSSSPSR
jgi:hypothetical protein